MEDLKKLVQIEMIKRDIPSMANIARKCGWHPQALSAKFLKHTMRIDDLEKVANAMGCDVKITFVDKD